MKLSYSAVWDDTVAMLRAHASLITAIAGVFIFLPSLLIAYFIPEPQRSPTNPWAGLAAYLAENGHWLVLGQLVSMIGSIAVLLLIFGRGQLTVGTALARAFAALPFYFLVSFLSGLVILAGLMLLLVPGLYLLGRLAVGGVALIAEGRRNPLEALGRSVTLTNHNGWAVFALMLVVGLAGLIVLMVVTWVFGAIFLLLAGKGLGALLAMIATSAASTAFTILMLLLAAAIYRSLAGGSSAAGVVY